MGTDVQQTTTTEAAARYEIDAAATLLGDAVEALDRGDVLYAVRVLNAASGVVRQAEGSVTEHARERGHAWSEVGRALSISRQGAQQRHDRDWIGSKKG